MDLTPVPRLQYSAYQLPQEQPAAAHPPPTPSWPAPGNKCSLIMPSALSLASNHFIETLLFYKKTYEAHSAGCVDVM